MWGHTQGAWVLLRPALGRMWPAYFWNSPLESPLGELVRPPPRFSLSPAYRALIQVLGPRLRTVLVIGVEAIPLHPQLLTTFLHLAQLPPGLLNLEQLPS